MWGCVEPQINSILLEHCGAICVDTHFTKQLQWALHVSDVTGVEDIDYKLF